jgi:hypothetical protein
MASAARRGVSGAATLAVLALALAAGSAYAATAVEIGDLPALVLITFVPPAAFALIAAMLDIAAAMTGGTKGKRLLEFGLIMFGISLGWLALCGVMAAGAAVLEPNSLSGD